MWSYADGGSSSLDPDGRITQRRFTPSRFLAIALSAAALVASFIGFSQRAEALPSFARQTGQPCGTCHTDFPGLTPFGRLFKLNGYTTGGGKYRTALFPSQDNATKALADYAKNAKAEDSGDSAKKSPSDSSDTWVPPISMMTIFGFTHRNMSLDSDAASPFNPNDNVRVEQFSLFWGGAITDHIGAFSQFTYGGPPVGGPDPADSYSSMQWGWDNTDIRYANTGRLDKFDVVYGITANNNPTVGDPWNTTPAWGFPYAAAGDLAPGPGAATLIDGALAGSVAGVGGYAWFNNLVYVQLSGYRTLGFHTLASLGFDPFGAPVIDGIAPYWRVAVEPHWGSNWWEFGAFGTTARVHNWTFATDPDGLYLNETYSDTDRFTDFGFDTQYQYQGDNYWITLRGTYIHEDQALDSTFANGGSANPTNTLNTLRLYGSLAYGDDNRVVLSGQYFDTWGSSDDTLYAGNASGYSPDSDGFTAEIAYIPYINSHPKIWPWANARVGLQYTWYNKFDGTAVGASDNNTLFAYLWIAM